MWTQDQQRECLRVLRKMHARGDRNALWWLVLLAMKVRWGLRDQTIASLKWGELDTVLGVRTHEESKAWWWRAVDEWYAEMSERGERGVGWHWFAKIWDRGIWRKAGTPRVQQGLREVLAVVRGVAGLESVTWSQIGKWHHIWKDQRGIRRALWRAGSGGYDQQAVRQQIRVVQQIHAGEVGMLRETGVDWAKVREWWGVGPMAKHRIRRWPELDSRWVDPVRVSLERKAEQHKAKRRRRKEGIPGKVGRPRKQT